MHLCATLPFVITGWNHSYNSKWKKQRDDKSINRTSQIEYVGMNCKFKKKNESTWPCATFVSQSAWSDANAAWWHLSANAVMQMIYRRVTPLDYILYISLSLSRPSLPLCVFVCVRVRALSCDLIDWAQTMERPSEASRMNERYSTQVENHQPCVHLTKKNKKQNTFLLFYHYATCVIRRCICL